MRTLPMNKKAVAILAAGLLTVATAGGAYAYWTTTGSGGGSAAVAASNGTLVLTSSGLSGVVTPGSSRTFTIHAANAGTTDLRVGFVNTVVSSIDAGCQALIGDFSVAPVDASAVNVAAGNSDTVLGTATLVYAQDAANNQNACKSKPLTFAFTTTP